MDKIKIAKLDSKNLEKGDYRKNFPEYYALKKIVENNDWHLKQNVFAHSLAVFKNLEKILEDKILPSKTKQKIKKHLKKKVGKYSQEQLLRIAALLHDIAKPETFLQDSRGQTKCPAHEIIGSMVVSKFKNRFALDRKGQDLVQKIIAYHGLSGQIGALILHKNHKKKYLQLFRKIVQDIYVELWLLLYADLLGSDMQKINPRTYLRWKKLLQNICIKS